MQTKRLFFQSFVGWTTFFACAFFSFTAWGQGTSNINQAFQVARQAVSPDVQTRVVSLYGIGTPDAIQKWYIIFYDATVPSHGRAVLVENNQITKTYAARGGTTYQPELCFDPSRITSETLALNASQGYAAKHHIAYDTVHALLKQTSPNQPFCWRIELIDSGTSCGFVYVKALDDSVASFVPPGGTNSPSDTGIKGIGDKVKNTFLGIGGDLEEFFTGERTVDK